MVTMKANPICIKCGVKLTDDNWYPSRRWQNSRICKECNREWNRLWRKANSEKAKAISTRGNRKQGHLPFDENKGCASFLGIHISERVLSYAFKDVVRMPYGNPGYDIICNKGKKIDVKSSCTRRDMRWNSISWAFNIGRNTTADYFLCLAFDNREDLNPLHAWLIPGSKINHLTGTSISPSTLHKWDAYALDTSKIGDCCDAMR